MTLGDFVNAVTEACGGNLAPLLTSEVIPYTVEGEGEEAVYQLFNIVNADVLSAPEEKPVIRFKLEAVVPETGEDGG